MAKNAEKLSQETLLSHMAKLPHGRASFKQLARELGIRGTERATLDDLLSDLVDRGDLLQLRSGYAVTTMSREFTVGTLRMHRDGYGFVVPDRPVQGMQGDLFIPPDSAARAMHGDRVLARIQRIEATGRADGEVVRVLRRGHMTVVGEFVVKRQGCFVKPHDDRIQQWIEIAEGMEMPPTGQSIDRVGVEPVKIASVEDMDGLIVNVEIVDFPERTDESPVGRVIEVLGHPDDFGIDVEIIIRKFHIPHQFPPAVIQEAQSYPLIIPQEEIAKRRDFRDLAIVTIDGETARDFDDAVWVERLPNGNWALQVHIADVSYYVRPGTAIDKEAAMRGTSVYFPDRAVPMLPVELSTELCSLKPQVDRLVMSALLEIDPKGDTVRQEFTRGVIRSAERMTYTDVWALLEGDPALRQRYAPLVDRFELMRDLATLLNRRRHKRGSIDFDMPEAKIEFDPEGQMTGVTKAERNFAHRIIEEFMLAANEAVASHLAELEFPVLYRIHETPAANRLADFEEIASRFGYSLVEGGGGVPAKKIRTVTRHRDGRKTGRETTLNQADFTVSSRAYQRLVAKLEGKPEERILTYLMLRSLKQAKYSEQNKGHYALAAAFYTHFTSPIRRYPDLIVHRVLGDWIDGKQSRYDEERLRILGEECSTTERRADEAERELVEWKKARFMEDHVGEQFKGLIISTTRFGFFVELEQYFVEGLVPIDSLPGDRYYYNENTRRITADRSKREFAIGDQVDVVLDRVEPMERRLQFSLFEPETEKRRRRKRG